MSLPEPTAAPPIRSPLTARRLGLVGLLCLCLFSFFWRLGAVPLFDLDEALYVACARQMAETGDWVTPRLNSRPHDRPAQTRVAFYEKPILVYWAAASSWKLFGRSEWAARLPSAGAALLTTFAIALFGIRRFGTRAGLLAGLVYATAPLTVLDARQMTTDGLLVLWLTIALFAFWTVFERTRATLFPALIFWSALGLAVLTKGVVGVLLTGLIIALFLVADFSARRLRPPAVWLPVLRRMFILPGLLLTLAIATPWHVLVARTGERDAQGRTFVQEYLLRQHIGRFRGGDTVHNAPPPSYLVFFLVGFFPWACFAPVAFRWRTAQPDAPRKKAATLAEPYQPAPTIIAAINSLEERLTTPPQTPNSETERAAHRFLLLWFWTIFIFFTLGAAKLPTYIAPAYPAAALLIGRWLSCVWESGSRRALLGGMAAAFATSAALAVVAFLAPRFVPANSPVPPDIARLALHLTLLLAIGCLAALVCFGLERRNAGVFTLAGTMLALFGVGVTEGYTVAAQQILLPYQEVAQRANNMGSDVSPVLYYRVIPRRPSMLYYARYSPLERKEQPLLPFLRRYVPANQPALLITSRRVFETELPQELANAPDVVVRSLSQTGAGKEGWVLARISYLR